MVTSAINIVRERACKSHACHLMLRDLGSKNEEHRNRAVMTVMYLHDSSKALM